MGAANGTTALQSGENWSSVTAPEPGPPESSSQPSAAQNSTHRRKAKFLDVETAQAILAEPFDEAAEADRAIPLPYITKPDGSRAPLDGVLSVFLTATTLQLLHIPHLADTAIAHMSTATLEKEKILGDIQFRGAISDFHAYKQAIVDGDAEPFVLRVNAADTYGDGNNFELAVSSAAIDVWEAGDLELERRKTRDERVALRTLAEKSLPPSAREIKVLQLYFISVCALVRPASMHQQAIPVLL
jgi:dynein intermediate chain 3, axonemal